MINFSNYYCLVILLIFGITTCKADNSNTTVPKKNDSNDNSLDDISDSGLKFDRDVCELPIDEGDCGNESLDTNEDSADSKSDAINELYKLNDFNDLNESNESLEINESNAIYFGYNKNTKKCEQFNYDGCGGNGNRFNTDNECRKVCYTPLKNFLAKVTDLLLSRVINGTLEFPAT